MRVRKPKHSTNIDISSLIDVLFILLVFLMLAVRFTEPTSTISLDLPKSKTDSFGSQSYVYKIQMKAVNEIYLNGEKVALSSLSDQIQKNTSQFDAVSLEVDQKIEFGNFVTVTDLLKAKGFEKIDIKTKKD
ncbi:ExbD/TolR family protein [Leptospira jelokensis]|uniref:Biopolymer transporter ExbD n=1 Tax=Leptospira jelokensis TaxID=2484931 RepID=A0A4Z1A1B3_9LEPT|nr:biopolymer transporter ExbD [Leptospira jelokensis]TGL62633.1 biopolymer transporter ExbD [Leptospira jelokensis]TGM06429.1 biopolymer transporter ExbD [Leptospira jelokensis]